MRFILSCFLFIVCSTTVFAQEQKATEQYLEDLFNDFKKGEIEAIAERFIDEKLLAKVIIDIEKKEPDFFKLITKDSVLVERIKAKKRFEKSLKQLYVKFNKVSGSLREAEISDIDFKQKELFPVKSFRATINFKLGGKEGWLSIREIAYDDKRDKLFILSDKARGEITDPAKSSVTLRSNDVVIEDISGDYNIPEPMPKVERSEIFEVVEQMPEFPGGKEALHQYLTKNIRHPKICQAERVAVKVISQFIVREDGSIDDIKVIKNIGDITGSYSKEAIRVIKEMPKWNPGKNRGKAVSVRFTLPVSFHLK